MPMGFDLDALDNLKAPRLSDVLRMQAQRAAGVLPQDRSEAQADGSGHYRQDSPYLGASHDALTFANRGNFGGGLVSWPFEFARGQGRDGSFMDRLMNTADAFSPVQAAIGAGQSFDRQARHLVGDTQYDMTTPDGRQDAFMDVFGLAGMLPAAGVAATKAAPKRMPERATVAASNPDDVNTSAVLAAMQGQERPKGITAYHGSPHDFDRFDMSKIGTGEGAQAYGHGLYFAENEGVARSYRDTLAGSKFPDGSAFDDANPAHQAAAYIAGTKSKAEAIAALNDDIAMSKRQNDGAHAQRLMRARGMLERGEPIPEINNGHIYEVRINADPAEFLDWDKPLADQPKVASLVGTDEQGRLVLPNGERAPPDKLRGESFYRAFAEAKGGGTQPGSQALRDAGIPGIRYLDQGSRGAGEGSRNYVVFDDKLVEILKKYSNAPDPTTAAILAAMQAQEKTKGITAYHASPHTFDKFDMSKVGTGMGYLDEGHGLYFGTNKDWVDGYAKEIGPNAKRYEVSIDADPSKFLNWDDIPRDMQEILKTKRGADAARQVGVPGIVVKGGNYGDSYVMFDDKPISINRTYANPADPTTAAILALLTNQQGAQPQQ